MRRLHDRQGFTLTEMIIVIAIFVPIVIVVGTLLITGLQNYADNAERIAGQNNVRMSLVQINRDLRDADASDVLIGAGGKSISIGTETYTFDADAGTLTFTDGIHDPRVVGSGLSAFSASKVDDTVTINIKATWNDSAIKTKVTLKNIPRPTPTP